MCDKENNVGFDFTTFKYPPTFIYSKTPHELEIEEYKFKVASTLFDILKSNEAIMNKLGLNDEVNQKEIVFNAKDNIFGLNMYFSDYDELKVKLEAFRPKFDTYEKFHLKQRFEFVKDGNVIAGFDIICTREDKLGAIYLDTPFDAADELYSLRKMVAANNPLDVGRWASGISFRLLEHVLEMAKSN